MIYTNGHIVISDKSTRELLDFARRAGLSVFVGHARNPHYEIPEWVSAEVLRNEGAQFVFGMDFEKILKSEKYRQRCERSLRIQKARVAIQGVHFLDFGETLGRVCPQCHQVGWVSVYRDRRTEAIAYITKETWRCMRCQNIADEVARNQT